MGGNIKSILTLHGGKPFKSPRYVTVTSRDDVIVSDSGDAAVVAFNDSGQVMWENCEDFTQPAGVCSDSLGIGFRACWLFFFFVISKGPGMNKEFWPTRWAINIPCTYWVSPVQLTGGTWVTLVQPVRPWCNSTTWVGLVQPGWPSCNIGELGAIWVTLVQWNNLSYLGTTWVNLEHPQAGWGSITWVRMGQSVGTWKNLIQNWVWVSSLVAGNVLVCDEAANKVVVLDTRGRLLCTVLESGDITRPVAVALDPEGRIVVGQKDGRVKIFTYLQPSWCIAQQDWPGHVFSTSTDSDLPCLLPVDYMYFSGSWRTDSVDSCRNSGSNTCSTHTAGQPKQEAVQRHCGCDASIT